MTGKVTATEVRVVPAPALNAPHQLPVGWLIAGDPVSVHAEMSCAGIPWFLITAPLRADPEPTAALSQERKVGSVGVAAVTLAG